MIYNTENQKIIQLYKDYKTITEFMAKMLIVEKDLFDNNVVVRKPSYIVLMGDNSSYSSHQKCLKTIVNEYLFINFVEHIYKIIHKYQRFNVNYNLDENENRIEYIQEDKDLNPPFNINYMISNYDIVFNTGVYRLSGIKYLLKTMIKIEIKKEQEI